MNLSAWFDPEASALLARTLCHFLWQGAAVAIAVMIVLHRLRKASSNVRYLAGLTGLGLMAISPLITSYVLTIAPGKQVRPHISPGNPAGSIHTAEAKAAMCAGAAATEHSVAVTADSPASGSAGKRPPVAPAGNPVMTGSTAGPLEVEPKQARPWIAWVTAGYLAGATLMVLRLLVGLHGGWRLRRKANPVGGVEWMARLFDLAETLGLRFTPAVAWCDRVAVPVVVGVFRPVILLPAALATGMTAEQIEAVLLHEMAHIKRLDPLVSLLQSVIESLLFFHPGVWWLSRRIRIEREHCCDDLAASACANSQTYADTLLRAAEIGLEAKTGRRPSAALAADGGRPSQLGSRVRRILGIDSRPRLRKLWTSALAFAAVGAIVLLLLPDRDSLAKKFHTTASPDDEIARQIELIGVRPNDGDIIYDARGTAIGQRYSRQTANWDVDDQCREFIFRLPNMPGHELTRMGLKIRPAGWKRRMGGGFGFSNRLESDPSGGIIFRSMADFPKTYSTRFGCLFRRKNNLDEIDLTFTYFIGPPGPAVATFTGPFELDKSVSNAGCMLTPVEERWGGEPETEFEFVFGRGIDFNTPILAYDSSGRRYVMRIGSARYGPAGGRGRLRLDRCRLSDVVRITVGEKPRKKTFHNVFVGYSTPEYPPYMDAMAKRLGLAGKDMPRCKVRRVRYASMIIDVARGDHVHYVVDAFEKANQADIDAMAPDTRMKIRNAAEAMIDNGFVVPGLKIAVRMGWPEFLDKAIDHLESGMVSDRLASEICDVLSDNRKMLSSSSIARLSDLVMRSDDGPVLRLSRLFFVDRSAEGTEALWRMANAPESQVWQWHTGLSTLTTLLRVWDDPDELAPALRARAEVVRAGLSRPFSLSDDGIELLKRVLTPRFQRMHPGLVDQLVDVLVKQAGLDATTTLVELVRQTENLGSWRKSKEQAFVIRAAAILNRLHGIDLGGFARSDGADELQPYFIDAGAIREEILAWADRGEDWRVLPAGFDPLPGAARIVWRNLTNPEDSVIVAYSGDGARQILTPLTFAKDFAVLRIRQGAVGREIAVDYMTGSNNGGASVETARVNRSAVPKEFKPSRYRWQDQWEMWVEDYSDRRSVLDSTKLFKQWSARYLDSLPLAQPLPLVFHQHTDLTAGRALARLYDPTEDWRSVWALYVDEKRRAKAGETIEWDSGVARLQAIQLRMMKLFYKGKMPYEELISEYLRLADVEGDSPVALAAMSMVPRVYFKDKTSEQQQLERKCWQEITRRWPTVVTYDTLDAHRYRAHENRTVDQWIQGYRWYTLQTDQRILHSLRNWDLRRELGQHLKSEEGELARLKKQLAMQSNWCAGRLVRKAKAQGRLQDVIDAFPGTAAAEKAADALNRFGL